MTYTASAYFLGKYRPLYVTGENPPQALAALARRIESAPAELRQRLNDVWNGTTQTGWRDCTAYSSEHGAYGIGWRKGEPWGALVDMTRDLPPCPGVEYCAGGAA